MWDKKNNNIQQDSRTWPVTSQSLEAGGGNNTRRMERVRPTHSFSVPSKDDRGTLPHLGGTAPQGWIMFSMSWYLTRAGDAPSATLK